MMGMLMPMKIAAACQAGRRLGLLGALSSAALRLGLREGKLEVLHVACRKCDRRGQYPVARLIERYGRDAKLVDWKDQITADYPCAYW
jgi:hypothetical protein